MESIFLCVVSLSMSKIGFFSLCIGLTYFSNKIVLGPISEGTTFKGKSVLVKNLSWFKYGLAVAFAGLVFICRKISLLLMSIKAS